MHDHRFDRCGQSDKWSFDVQELLIAVEVCQHHATDRWVTTYRLVNACPIYPYISYVLIESCTA